MNVKTELLFLGLPETGKTTYFVALDEVLNRQTKEHGLVNGGFAANRSYIEQAKKAWRAGKDVGRTVLLTTDDPVELLVSHPKSDTTARLVAPDVNGEFFDRQWVDRKWQVSYRKQLASVAGAFVFIHAAFSGRNPEMTEVWKNLPHDESFSADDIKNLTSFAAKLKQPPDALGTLISDRLSADTKQRLVEYQAHEANPNELQVALLKDLNEIIHGSSIYDSQHFSKIVLRPETERLLGHNLTKKNLIHLNRLLLEDAFPQEISRKITKPWEPRLAAKQVKLVELLQFISEQGQARQPLALAVMISAWDVIESEGKPKIRPEQFLKSEWSLLYQYLQANPELFRSRIYGVSARGGDDAAQAKLFSLQPHERVWLKDGAEVTKDLTRLLRWLLGWE